MKASEIGEGNLVLLYYGRGKRWLIRTSPKGRFDTHAGYLDLEAVSRLEYGSPISSSLGETFWCLKPTIEDFVMKGERRTQVVYPKDIGLIAVKTGIGPGSIVVEAGTGSGALTTFLAHLARPAGHVYSYEIREEFVELARRNIAKAGLEAYVTVKHVDAKAGIDITGADVAIIDVGDPWSLVPAMHGALRGSGRAAAISPTVNQAEKVTPALAEQGFVDIETVEVLLRRLEARPGMSRPSSRMVGHTAYLTFATKVLRPEP